MSRVQPSRRTMRSTVRLSSHCLTALLPRLPPRVDSPYPTLPLHSPARADPLWTQSGARDFYRDQARASGRRVESIPVSTNYFAEGANFPSHELRCVVRLPRLSQCRHSPATLLPIWTAPRPRAATPPTLPSERSHPRPLSPHFSQSPTRHPRPRPPRLARLPPRDDGPLRMPRRVARSVPRRPSRAHTRAKFFRRPVRRPPPEACPRPPRRVRPRAPGRPRDDARAVLPWREPARARRGRLGPTSTPPRPRASLECSARNPITANPRRRRYLTSPISSFPSVRPRAKRRSAPNTTWIAAPEVDAPICVSTGIRPGTRRRRSCNACARNARSRRLYRPSRTWRVYLFASV